MSVLSAAKELTGLEPDELQLPIRRKGAGWRPPVRINLLRGNVRTDGLFLRRPPSDTAVAKVQLLKLFGGRWMGAPMIHDVGYVVVPFKAAPKCSPGGGPYGRIVWIEPTRGHSYRDCPNCAAGTVRKELLYSRGTAER